MAKELDRRFYKVYLSFTDGEYYGNSFDWEIKFVDEKFNEEFDYPKVDTEDAREYTIQAIKFHLDELSEFIKPSRLLDFIKTIGDPNTGEALYANLEENILYLMNITNRVISGAETDYIDKFRNFIWGKSTPYGDDDECHLCFLGRKNDLTTWLKPHEEFVNIFKSYLIEDPFLYLLAFDDANLVQSQIKRLQEIINSVIIEKKNMDKKLKTLEAELRRLQLKEKK